MTADEVRRADPEVPANIKKLVGEKGAGVMMIGGRRNFGNGPGRASGPARADQTELRDVLPVDLSGDGEVSQARRSRWSAPRPARTHFLLRLADDPRRTRRPGTA